MQGKTIKTSSDRRRRSPFLFLASIPAFVTLLVLVFSPALISSCSVLKKDFETPVVTINAFEILPSRGIAPRFRIGLHIVNPNRTELSLKGVSYTIALEGHEIIKGVSNKLPKIEAYGEGDVILTASVDIFNSIGFLSDLIQNKKKEKISYTLEAKLDTGILYKVIRVTRNGKISLSETK